MSKTKQDNDMTDRIGLVYAEIKTQILIPILLGTICDENHTRQLCDWLEKCNLCFHDTELLLLIGFGVIFNKNQTRQLRD